MLPFKQLPIRFWLCILLAYTACQQNPQPFDLSGKNWQLTAIQGDTLPDNYGFNMRFDNGRISGKGACNYLNMYYHWRYTDSLSVFGGDQTMIYCEPEARMNWDDRFIAEMMKVRALHVPDSSHLELRCHDGGKLFFTRTISRQ